MFFVRCLCIVFIKMFVIKCDYFLCKCFGIYFVVIGFFGLRYEKINFCVDNNVDYVFIILIGFLMNCCFFCFIIKIFFIVMLKLNVFFFVLLGFFYLIFIICVLFLFRV